MDNAMNSKAAVTPRAGRPCHDRASEKGFTLVEVMIAALIMTVGLLALAYGYGQGLAVVMAGQQNAIARQQARAAMEDLLAARNTGLLQFSQIENVSNGGVFLTGVQPLTLAPNPQGVLGTATDGQTPAPLAGYTRQITITDLSSTLKQVQITVLYTTPSGASPSSATNCNVGCYQITSDVYQSTD
jgi:prepilin-type N-terminal cleavage/methylation domain-containing protein